MSTHARTVLRARRELLRLVIFDCDGVLIDSEPIADRVVAKELAAVGWSITPAEAHSRFLGMRTPDMPPIIEAMLGRPLPEGWAANVAERMIVAMAQEAVLIPGAI